MKGYGKDGSPTGGEEGKIQGGPQSAESQAEFRSCEQEPLAVRVILVRRLRLEWEGQPILLRGADPQSHMGHDLSKGSLLSDEGGSGGVGPFPSQN